MELRNSRIGFGSHLLAQEFWQQAMPRTIGGIGHTAKDENAA